MDPAKRARLEAAGWTIGSAEDFLGCTDEERREIDRRLRFERAHAETMRVLGPLLRALAESDHKPAAADACRRPDGSCDGTCGPRGAK